MVAEHKPERLALHCSCGGCATGSVTAGEPARQFRAIWFEIHSGPGHAPLDTSAARKPSLAAALAREVRDGKRS